MENIKVDLFVKAKAVVTPLSNGEIAVYEPGFLAVSDGRIVEAGKYTDELPYRGKEFLSLPAHVIFPGFINTHTHSPMVLFRGLADDLPLKEWLENHIWPMEAKFINPDSVRDGALIACIEMALSGVTFFTDMYFAMDQVAYSAKRAGIKAQLGEGILEFPTPTSPTVDHAFKRTKELIEGFSEDPLIYPVVAPHSPYTCSADTLSKSAEIAEDYGVPLHIHLAEEKWELNNFLSEKGMSSVKYLNEIGFFDSQRVTAAHVNWLDEGDLDVLSEKNVGVAHNPRSNMKLATGICPVVKMLEAGVNVGIGTDGASSNNKLSVLDDAQVAALLHKI